ncbi:MAG TPA: phospholipase D-like domain-containing protein [Gemmatimonadales bacterium]|nr:phospholipase D-like domain-containing protein [Gemmatimonadales bacterium]
MRVTQTLGAGLTVRAIAGTHVVLLGFSMSKASAKNLLGFAIRREDVTEGENYWLRGLKTFKETQPIQVPGQSYSLLEHPVQSFRWSDYTAKPGHTYRYEIVPLEGKPKNLVQRASVIVEIDTESEGDPAAVHDVYFNRGVSASQAYSAKFGNARPDQLPLDKRAEAYAWLSRGLEEALLRFIGRANGTNFGLRAAVYEFNHAPVLQALKAAVDAGADVAIVYDAREDPPRGSSETAIAAAGLGAVVTPRTSNPSFIAHNKFIVLLENGHSTAVWTGSTNFTRGGIYGQSNVGHVVRDAAVAQAYLDYWTQLAADPEAKDLRTWIQGHTPDPAGTPPAGTTALFSPRRGLGVLQWYADRLDEAGSCACMTAAFGVHPFFEAVLGKQRPHLRFVLAEKRDPEQDQWTTDRDVQVAVGGKIPGDALYGWTEEILTGFNFHVQYVHDKFMLIDPLSDDPIVVTGSANFSKASTEQNDENMLVIRGDTRVADIYLGEFMRLFSHHYFRDLIKKQQGETISTPKALYLAPTDSWTRPYFEEYGPKAKLRRLYAGVAE